MTEALLIMRQQIRVMQPQLVSPKQNFAEVDHAIFLTRLFIQLIQLLHGTRQRVCRGDHVRRPAALVFLGIDKPLDLLGRVAGIINIVVFHQTLDHTQLVVAVQNLEILRQSGFLPVLLEQAMCEAMKRADPHAVRRHVQQPFQTPFHFARCLVGKGHRHDRERRNILDLQQPDNPVYQYARFARTGSGQHQLMRRRCRHCVTLGIIKLINNQ